MVSKADRELNMDQTTTVPRLKLVMADAGLDAVTAMAPWNLIYTSGCHLVLEDLYNFNDGRDRFGVAIVPADGDPVLIVWSQEELYARANSWIKEVRPVKPFVRTVEVLAQVLEEMGLASANVGIEKSYMDLDTATRLEERLPKAHLDNADPVFSKARMIKLPFEIDLLERVGLIAAKATQLAWEVARPGDAEYSVTANIVYHSIRMGAAPLVFNFGSGPNSAFGHRWSDDRRLQGGDIIHSDSKARLRGYWADVTRMAVVGEPSDYQATVYRKLAAIHDEVIDRMRPGVEARAIYEAARAAYRREGLEAEPRLLGHGIGLCLHEEPNLTPHCEEVLQPGMTVTVEPTYYGPSERYHYEDMVLVTQGEPKVLSCYCDTSKMHVIN